MQTCMAGALRRFGRLVERVDDLENTERRGSSATDGLSGLIEIAAGVIVATVTKRREVPPAPETMVGMEVVVPTALQELRIVRGPVTALLHEVTVAAFCDMVGLGGRCSEGEAHHKGHECDEKDPHFCLPWQRGWIYLPIAYYKTSILSSHEQDLWSNVIFGRSQFMLFAANNSS